MQERQSTQNYNHQHLEHAPLPVVTLTGAEMTVQFANGHALSLFKELGEGRVNKAISELIPEVFNKSVIKKIYENCFVKAQHCILEEKQINHSHEAKLTTSWFNVKCSPLKDEQGHVAGVITFFTDVSETVNSRKSIVNREDNLANFFKHAPIGLVCYRGSEFIVDFANDKALAMWGKSVEEVKGKPIHEIFPEVLTDPEINSRHKESLERLRRGETHIVNEVELTFLKNGKPKTGWYTYIHEPYTDGAGEIIGMMAIAIEVTDQKLAEEKLKELSQNLEIKVRERTAEITRINDLLSLRNEELNKTQSVLQQLIDSSIEYIAVIDRDLKFLAVNRAFETFIQKSRNELIGKEIFVAYGGARGSKQVELLQKVFAGETLHLRLNPAISRPNVWFDTHYVPLIINNQVEGVIALSRDITEIVKSEQDLANINRQLQEAQHLAKLGSWEWDVLSGTVIWSDEMYHIYGYEEKFPVDFVKATERMSPEDADRSSKRTQQYIQQAVENFRNNGETVYEVPSSEIRIQLPNGEKKLLRNTGKIQLTNEGVLHRFLGVLQDVTQIRSAEERLKKLIGELEEKNRQLESFNYVASHDLKEPLRNIRTMIDMVRLKGDESGAYLSKIDRAATRMSDLIESILKLSEASNAETKFENLDLNKVLESCKNDLESRIKETQAEIVSETLPLITGNESQMAQVFSNLLGNSLKFCKTRPIVQIKCAKASKPDVDQSTLNASTKEYWRITIADNGIGFDPQFKDQIFEPFQRLHGRSDYGGTGIGLSIVKKIIERHNGFIDVESETGKGSKFTISLPV
jgi:PAS domain S-box-containing protein